MIGTARDLPDDWRRYKRHRTRLNWKDEGWKEMVHKHRRRALRRRLKAVFTRQ